MLNILNQPEDLLRGIVLSRVDNLYTRARDGRLLVMNPRLGLYAIFREPYIQFFNSLKKPVSYKDFISNDQGMPPAFFITFMETAFGKGLISLSGRTFSPEQTYRGRMFRSKVLALRFVPGGEGPERFLEAVERFPHDDKATRVFVHIQGETARHYGEIPALIGKIACLYQDSPTPVGISVDLEKPGDAACFAQRDDDLEFTLNMQVRCGKEDLSEAIMAARGALKKNCPVSVSAIISNPDDIPGTVEKLVEGGIPNIGIRMSREVVLGDAPLTAHLKTMENFARKTLEALEMLGKKLAGSPSRIYLADVMRFVMRLFKKYYPHTCGRRPCGLGSHVQVCRDDGVTLACAEAGPRSAEKLVLPPSSLEWVAQSPEYAFWNGNGGLGVRCSRCPWQQLCGGGCPVLAFEKYGDPAREDPRCRYFQVIFEELVWLFHDNPSLANKIGGIWQP
jgi:radical SAM protein with 4Fe4S-binding SPASM domain